MAWNVCECSWPLLDILAYFGTTLKSFLSFASKIPVTKDSVSTGYVTIKKLLKVLITISFGWLLLQLMLMMKWKLRTEWHYKLIFISIKKQAKCRRSITVCQEICYKSYKSAGYFVNNKSHTGQTLNRTDITIRLKWERYIHMTLGERPTEAQWCRQRGGRGKG